MNALEFLLAQIDAMKTRLDIVQEFRHLTHGDHNQEFFAMLE